MILRNGPSTFTDLNIILRNKVKRRGVSLYYDIHGYRGKIWNIMIKLQASFEYSTNDLNIPTMILETSEYHLMLCKY